MRRGILLLTAVLVLLGGTNAYGVDTDGKFGVGGNASLSEYGVSGLGLNYWVGHLKAGLIAGFEMTSPSEGDSTTKLDIAFHGLYALARSKRANLASGIRVNLIDLVGATGTETAMGFEVPIEAEFWVTNHVTITAHAGLSMYEDGDDTVVRLGAPGFNGGAGFNYYF